MKLDDDTLDFDFYGADPLAGDDACRRLTVMAPEAAARLILDGRLTATTSPQVLLRLRSFASALGPAIVPSLVETIKQGSWNAKGAAAVCFAGLRESDATALPLVSLLKTTDDPDVQRRGIEALGYLRASRWSSYLEDLSRAGHWTYSHQDQTDEAYFRHLSPFVIAALARFAGAAEHPNDAYSRLRIMRSYVEQRQELLPDMGDAYGIVEGVLHEFGPACVDGLMRLWEESASDRWRQVTCAALASIRSVRSAKFLLQIVASPDHHPVTRTAASVALGELRDNRVALQVAEHIRRSGPGSCYIGWAFSSLRMIPVDWSGTESLIDIILARDETDEQNMQLHYSLALAQDSRVEKALVERLDAKADYVRWTAAVSLARLKGSDSRRELERRADEAGSWLERCGFRAALVHAGDPSQLAPLHEALGYLTELPLLRTLWRVAILGAFRCSNAFDPRAFGLWWAAAELSPALGQFGVELPAGGTSTALPTVPHQVRTGAKTGDEMITLLAASQVAGVAGNAVSIIDKIYAQFVAYKTKSDPSVQDEAAKAAVVNNEGGKVLTTVRDGVTTQAVSYEQLSQKLSPTDLDYIKAKDAALNLQYKVWLKAYPQVSTLADPVSRAQSEVALAQVAARISGELTDILNFLEGRLGLRLDDHYVAIREVANQ